MKPIPSRVEYRLRERVKPRIVKVNHVWMCYGDNLTAFGSTPASAFSSWAYLSIEKDMSIVAKITQHNY